MDRAVRTPDGRTLAVEDAGDPAGGPVLAHLGMPNSRHLYGPAHCVLRLCLRVYALI